MNEQIVLTDLVTYLAAYFWPFVRISTFVVVMPVLSGAVVPGQVRALIAIALTFLLAPLVPGSVNVEFMSLNGLILVVQEAVIGVAMAFIVQLVFDAIALGGQVISMSMGLGFAVFLDRARGVNVPVLGQFFLMLAVLVFLALDGHLMLIHTLADSFQLLPIGSGGLTIAAISGLLAWTSQLFIIAMKIALPAVTGLLVVNLAFGVTSRAAPTLNLFAVGFPAAMLFGFVVIFLSMGSLVENMIGSTNEALAAMRSLFSP